MKYAIGILVLFLVGFSAGMYQNYKLMKLNEVLYSEVKRLKSDFDKYKKFQEREVELPDNLNTTDRIVFTKAILDASDKFNIDIEIITSIISIESDWNRYARGSAGEIGLMQIKHTTQDFIVKQLKLEGYGELSSPYWNIMYGTAYLRILSDKYKGNILKIIVGYNQGHNADILKDSKKMSHFSYWKKYISIREG